MCRPLHKDLRCNDPSCDSSIITCGHSGFSQQAKKKVKHMMCIDISDSRRLLSAETAAETNQFTDLNAYVNELGFESIYRGNRRDKLKLKTICD